MRHAPSSIFSESVSLAVFGADAPVSRAARLLAGLVRLLHLPHRVIASRRDMALLQQMDAHELADIGLSRQDLRDAAALPLGQAPGHLLNRRATERRRAALARRR